MAKESYIVLRSGTYGNKGSVIELDLGKEGLSKRQGVMLKLYEKPVVKADESAELTALKADNKALKADNVKLTDELTKLKADNVK